MLSLLTLCTQTRNSIVAGGPVPAAPMRAPRAALAAVPRNIPRFKPELAGCRNWAVFTYRECWRHPQIL